MVSKDSSLENSEKYLERKLNEAVKRLGGESIKLEARLRAGLPDRMLLLPNGLIVFVELKTKGKKPTRIQTLTHDRFRDLGFRVEVIDNYNSLLKLIENV
jgi:hypothetical protein